MQRFRMSEQLNIDLAEVRYENEEFPTFMTMQQNENTQLGNDIAMEKEKTDGTCSCNCRCTSLILMTLFHAYDSLGAMVAFMIVTYKLDSTPIIDHCVFYGVIGCWYCYVIFQNSPSTYGYAASVHFLLSGFSISVAYIYFYCCLMNINVNFTDSVQKQIVANHTDNMPQNENYDGEFNEKMTGKTRMTWMFIGQAFNMFLTALLYYKCGAEPISEETSNEEQRKHAVNLDAPQNDVNNEETSEDKTTYVMVVISLVFALIHFILFGMLVRDGGNRFACIKFPQAIYYLLVGTLGFYSIYIASMQSVQVYRNAACIHTGLSMIAFSFSFISLFHSFMKFTGYLVDQDISEGIEYFMYGILVIILGIMYAVVAYLYEDYDPETGSSIINSFSFPDVDGSSNENFDADKFYKKEYLEAEQIPVLNNL